MDFLLLLPTFILAYLLWEEKRSNRVEREELLDRIQAPEKVIHRSFEPASLEQAVRFDDDDDYWKAVEEREAA